jgi:hypothetical protein
MGLLDLLKKLGILKVGGQAGVYTSAKDRPVDEIEADLGGMSFPARDSTDDRQGGGGGF